MKFFIPLLVTGAMFVGTAPAFADDAAGAVKQINTGSRELTLEDGRTYIVMGGIDISKIKVGDKVKLTYTPSNQLWMSLGIHGNANQVAANP